MITDGHLHRFGLVHGLDGLGDRPQLEPVCMAEDFNSHVQGETAAAAIVRLANERPGSW